MRQDSIDSSVYTTTALSDVTAALAAASVRVRPLASGDDWITLEYTYGSTQVAHTTEGEVLVITGEITQRQRCLIEAHAALYYCP